MTIQLILLGAPGSGKGSQAKRLVTDRSFIHVSTGDLLRSEIAKESELGKRVDGVLKAGELVDDNLVLELLSANCDVNQGNYIFDGFPRNLEQAQLLNDRILKSVKNMAIYFHMDTKVLVDRLCNRRICKTCNGIYNLKSSPPKVPDTCDKCGTATLYQRDDDKEEVIQNRLEVYNKTIEPVLAYYRELGSLKQINADGKFDDVFAALCGEIEG